MLLDILGDGEHGVWSSKVMVRRKESTVKVCLGYNACLVSTLSEPFQVPAQLNARRKSTKNQ